MSQRRISQIAISITPYTTGIIFALANDGTLWKASLDEQLAANYRLDVQGSPWLEVVSLPTAGSETDPNG